ncbi:DUF3263 domain-containing protein [Micromonospora matsumotoense]|uniref:DUF3263 domain-containing protein n=1 Tax=Micromonospora matsumotoense TaxID=121616 RepID=UPI0033EADADE
MPPADAVPRSESSPEPVDAPPQVPSPRSVPDAERSSAHSDKSTGPERADAGSTDTERAGIERAGAERAGAERAGGGISAGVDELTERELRILAFELQWWRHAGAKEQAIRDTFGLSATRYYQLLNGLLDRPAALAAEPLLIGRLRRLRASRARNRRR